ncbi:hypothetical protein SNK04_013584 [Fusarium graminearum]
MMLCKTHYNEPTDPLTAFFRRHDDPEYSRTALLPPSTLAAASGNSDVIGFLHRHYELDTRGNLDIALFFANRQGYTETAAILLGYGAKPAEKFTSNGMHSAAWQGLNEQIEEYVDKYKADPDVIDKSSATPVIYAILGVQDETGA